MANAKILKKYLVDEDKGYLLDKNNNGKVIMLSGKWGSGKTHFWKNDIEKELIGNDKQIPNHYVSLYGKTSIQEIKNEIFLKIFESVDSYEVIEKGKALAKNTVGLATSFFGAISVLGVNFDLSKMTDKPFDKLEKVLDDNKLKKTIEYLNSGAIICFDDFERKSKDIDLNDLFGFITQLTLNFDCKVVIILNNDVFEGEEKKIFSNVKEKSVSKFLKYEPSIKELFETIFSIEKYRILDEHKEIILKTIEETEELNARIYIQVLDNLVEWIDKKQEIDEDILRCLILVNIYFVLHHILFYKKTTNWKEFGEVYDIKSFVDPLKQFEYYIFYHNHKNNLFEVYYEDVEKRIFEQKQTSDEKIKRDNAYFHSNKKVYFAKFNANKLNIARRLSNDIFQKINNFIETGILINE